MWMAGTTGSPPLQFRPRQSRPSIPPTWKRVGSNHDGMGKLSKFGSKVSISSDGSTVVASYDQSGLDRWTRGTTGAVIFESNVTENGDEVWNEAAVVSQFHECKAGVMALSGNGKVAPFLTVGCLHFLGLTLWERGEFHATPTYSDNSEDVVDKFIVRVEEEKWFSNYGARVYLMDPFGYPDSNGDPALYNQYSPPEVAVSENGNVIATGNDGNVIVLEYNYSTGVQPSVRHSSAVLPKGGRTLSLSTGGNALAVAFYTPHVYEEVNGTERGELLDLAYESVEVRRRESSTGEWVLVGTDYPVGRSATIASTSLSADGTILAVGGTEEDGSPDIYVPCCRGEEEKCEYYDGRVRVYRFDDDDNDGGGNWTLLGQVLLGDRLLRDDFGKSVSLSRDGMRLTVGVPGSDAGGAGSGTVRVYWYDAESNEWLPLGGEGIIVGSESGEGFGSSVALSADGNRVVVGAPKNRAGGIDAGRVSVFELGN
mmetsp:Transcript_266/g.745  ORF Transcript_266/g.745 Transcript_266/m.745 type:complete len:483 (-) Transcript_266:123-1571(-)